MLRQFLESFSVFRYPDMGDCEYTVKPIYSLKDIKCSTDILFNGNGHTVQQTSVQWRYQVKYCFHNNLSGDDCVLRLNQAMCQLILHFLNIGCTCFAPYICSPLVP